MERCRDASLLFCLRLFCVEAECVGRVGGSFMLKNVFWHKHFLAVGGIETFLFSIAKKYKDRDITVVYSSGDPAQLDRMASVCRLIRWHGQRLECERLFLNYNTEIIDSVSAKDYIQILHADWSAVNIPYKMSPKITQVLAVSHATGDPFIRDTGRPVGDIMYLPLLKQKPRKVLNLISATRLSGEKGYARMVKLADALDEAEIPYRWSVFTTGQCPDKRFQLMENRLTVGDFIADSDYLVQLSDSEGFCYTVNEALMLGTPVIVTPCPAFEEIGVRHGVNGWVLPFDMSEVPVKEILAGLPRFDFAPVPDKWGSYLLRGKCDYKPEDVQMQVVCRFPYFDKYFNRRIERGEVLTVPVGRYETLIKTAYVRDFYGV